MAIKYTCLSIAGFDGSGGAGIQADLKTFSALGCYGMNVLTALPVQNTCGVKNCYEIPIKAIEEQLECIFEDITPDSIKIGMLFSIDVINVVSKFLEKNAVGIPIVLDPVIISKNESPLLLPSAIEIMKENMIPLSTIITPNLPEADKLVGKNDDLKLTAEKFINLGANSVLIKGGHASGNDSNDLFMDKHGLNEWLEAKRIKSNNTHGTGCTLSAAICANLAKNQSLLESCKNAKNYLWHAISATSTKSIGKGNGPVDHFFYTKNNITY